MILTVWVLWVGDVNKGSCSPRAPAAGGDRRLPQIIGAKQR